jgi:hypothetical protein
MKGRPFVDDVGTGFTWAASIVLISGAIGCLTQSAAWGCLVAGGMLAATCDETEAMMKKATRFSKAKLIRDLRAMCEERRLRCGFNPANGYSQVDGKGSAINREYGEWVAIATIISDIEGGYIGVEK